MRRLSLLLLIIAVPLSARNTFWGSRGTFKVYSARCEDAGMLTINLFHLEGYSETMENAAGVVVWERMAGWITSSLSFAPADIFEFSFSGSFLGFYNTSGLASAYGISDNYVGGNLKLGYPFYFNEEKTNWLGIGVLGNFYYHAPFSYVSTGTLPTPEGYEGGGLGLFSLGMGPLGVHLNGGYTYFSQGGGQPIVLGTGIEFNPIPYLGILVELHNLNSMESFGIDYTWTTLGLRVGTGKEGITFDIGGEIGIGDSIPQWNSLIAGIQLAFDVIKPAPGVAVLEGKVVDAETQSPLLATITFPGTDLAPIHTDPSTGEYIDTLAPGSYTIHVEAPGYRWQEKGIALSAGIEGILNFELRKKVTEVFLVGKVLDQQTKTPIKATITISGREPFSTDESGEFRTKITPGTYQVEASAPGYKSEVLPVVVHEDRGGELSFYLLKKVMHIQRIYFDPGSAVIKPESYPVLEDLTRVLKERPDIKVEIQGHTDSVGSESFNLALSQRRAEAVRNYLIMHGIDPSRLIAKGYGESRPIGDNRSISGRRMNRRIDFVIFE